MLGGGGGGPAGTVIKGRALACPNAWWRWKRKRRGWGGGSAPPRGIMVRNKVNVRTIRPILWIDLSSSCDLPPSPPTPPPNPDQAWSSLSHSHTPTLIHAGLDFQFSRQFFLDMPIFLLLLFFSKKKNFEKCRRLGRSVGRSVCRLVCQSEMPSSKQRNYDYNIGTRIT